MNERQQEAFNDFVQLCDPQAIVHGSCNTGLAAPTSDVDILTHQDLQSIQRKVVSLPSPKLSVLEVILHARVPRLVLRHANGIELDLVRYMPSQLHEEKDQMIQKILKNEPILKQFIIKVLDWGRRNRTQMPTRLGYPGSWTLTIIAVFFLQNYPRGCLLDMPSPMTSAKVRTLNELGCNADSLYLEFLPFLRDYMTQITVALSTPVNWLAYSPRRGTHYDKWSVIDPLMYCNLCQFRYEQAETISRLIDSEIGGSISYVQNNFTMTTPLFRRPVNFLQ